MKDYNLIIIATANMTTYCAVVGHVWGHYNKVTFNAYNSECSMSKLAKTHLALCKHSPALWIRPVLALGGCDSGV